MIYASAFFALIIYLSAGLGMISESLIAAIETTVLRIISKTF